MSDDGINALFTMTVWAMRSKNAQQIRKALDQALIQIETNGGFDTIAICDRYVGEFAKLGYQDEASEVRCLADKLRSNWKGSFAADGRQLEWWQTDSWIRKLDQLPVEFRSSRAINPEPGLFLYSACVIYFVGLFLFGFLAVIGIPPWLLFLFYIPSGVVGAFLLSKAADQKREKCGAESWCRLSREGVEFSEPNNHVKLLWSEVDSVNERYDSGKMFGDGEDEGITYDVAEIVGAGKKFRLSAKYFRDEEVKFVTAVGLLQTRGPNQKRNVSE